VKRLRVLFLSHWYPTAENPIAGIFVREHAKAAALGDEILVLHGAGPKQGVTGLWQMEEERDPALTEGIPTYRAWHRPKPLPGLTSFLYLWAMLRAASRLRRSGFRPDILHAHIYEAGVAAALLGWWWRLPVVISEHSSDFPRRRLPLWQVAKARFAFGRAARVLPVSQALQNGIEQYGIRAKFEIVPNAVDPALFHPPQRPRAHHGPARLLFVGSLIPVKGAPILLEALARLQRQRQDWQLDLIGDGVCRAEYEQMAAKMGLSDQVRFHGRQSKPQVAAWMRQADLFILPSLWENAPCVIGEAQATGLPVLASETGGLVEMITAETGRLAPAGDADALADAIAGLLDILPTFVPASILAYARRYHLAEVGQHLHELYRRCLNP
jgi:glycosyltransferase involved in cell wall biosynthesis